jgi:hypothetical protein
MSNDAYDAPIPVPTTYSSICNMIGVAQPELLTLNCLSDHDQNIILSIIELGVSAAQALAMSEAVYFTGPLIASIFLTVPVHASTYPDAKEQRRRLHNCSNVAASLIRPLLLFLILLSLGMWYLYSGQLDKETR